MTTLLCAFIGFMHGLWWLLVSGTGTWRDVWIMTAVAAVMYPPLLAMLEMIGLLGWIAVTGVK